MAAAHLIQIAKSLEKIEPSGNKRIDFCFADLKNFSDDDLIAKISNSVASEYQSIYSFHLNDPNLQSRFYDAFNQTRSVKPRKRAYARINKKADGKEFGNCFYVGSSRNTLTRIKQHLGLGAKTTYSLHMKYWAAGFDGRFNVQLHKFKLSGNQLALLPYVEDQFAWELNPMFGRRGSL